MNRIKRGLVVYVPQRIEVRPAPGEMNWNNCSPTINGEQDLIVRYAGEWEVCLDIGANTGEYSKAVLAVNPKCRVIAFEPNVDLVEIIRANGIGEVYPCAMGDSVEEILIHFNIDDPSQSSTYRKSESTQERKTCCISIDHFCREQGIERLSFVKIDTEGHELAVLRGAAGMLSRRAIDMVQFEYGGTYADSGVTLGQIYELLSPNYIIAHLMPGGMVPLPYGPKLETFHYSNWIAISRNLYACVAPAKTEGISKT